MSEYDELRKKYQPSSIKLLFIAESPPPKAEVSSSRHFYRSDRSRKEDRLFTNTIKALYPEASELTETEIQPDKEQWLQRFKSDGYYMIEALEESQVHEVTKQQRQDRIAAALPRLVERVKELAEPGTRVILIKSNVFDVATEPLREAGFNVLNKKLLDYPGRFNQKAYREKLGEMIRV